jgi:PAS domain-containing protein
VVANCGGDVMTVPQIDYAALYRQIPVPVAVLTPEFVIADVNLAYLQAAGRSREEVLGRDLFEAFPDNPWDPGDTGVRIMRAALQRVLATGQPDYMDFHRHDTEMPGSGGQFARRYWSVVNAPVFGPDGRVALIAFCPEEVTERMHRFMSVLERDATAGRPE